MSKDWTQEKAFEALEGEITALRAENERLRVESIQMQAALGYGILAEDERHILPSNPFKCGTCDASKHLTAENEKLRAYALKAFTVVEFCSGQGFLLQYPSYDCDDLLMEGVDLLKVETSEEARAALEEKQYDPTLSSATQEKEDE